MEIPDLITKAKERANLTSDYALAKVLGIERQIISQWKSGKRHPSNQEAIQLATLAGLDEMRVIAEIELRTANSEKKKEFWKHYIESRGLSACVVMTGLAISIALTPEPAAADVLQLTNYDAHFDDQNTPTIYIIRSSKNYKTLIFKALLCTIAALFNTTKNNNVATAFH